MRLWGNYYDWLIKNIEMSYLDVLLIIFPFKPHASMYRRFTKLWWSFLFEGGRPLALQHFHEQEHICHTLYNFKAWTFLHLPRSFFFLGHNFMVQRTLLKLLRKKKFSQTAEMAFFIHPLLELRDSAREIMNEFLILAIVYTHSAGFLMMVFCMSISSCQVASCVQ